jgi:alanyl-tRNA synthetase
MHVHIGTVEGGIISVGDEASFEIDVENRNQIRANHSVTHLLHAALREVLGEHVSQKGSLVSSDRLRFDLSHPKQITQKEIKKIEKIVNYHIRKNAFVDTQIMSPDEAIQAGAMALFGEKYGDEVRVVSMGFDDDNFTIELCGGTHVKRTGDIGFFKIISEGAVSSGVRRIEALTGRCAEKYIQEKQDILHDLSEELRVSPNDVLQRVKSIIADRKKLEKQLVETRKKLASGGSAKGSSTEVEKVKNISFSGKFIEGMPPKDLKGTADEIKKQIGSGVVALVTSNGGKATLVVGVTDDIKDKINAVDLVKAGSQAVGGKGGGGRPDMAQAGGPNGEKGNEAIKAIKDKLSELA